MVTIEQINSQIDYTEKKQIWEQHHILKGMMN